MQFEVIHIELDKLSTAAQDVIQRSLTGEEIDKVRLKTAFYSLGLCKRLKRIEAANARIKIKAIKYLYSKEEAKRLIEENGLQQYLDNNHKGTIK